MGWIRTLTSALVVSLGGIVSSAGAMGLDGFKEVRNGVRGFVCDLSERALLFRSMVTGLCCHFHNFPWLHKVFSQTISLLGDHLAAEGKKEKHFRSPF